MREERRGARAQQLTRVVNWSPVENTLPQAGYGRKESGRRQPVEVPARGFVVLLLDASAGCRHADLIALETVSAG